MTTQSQDVTGFDIIGDVHGQTGQLITLLQTLGYREEAGVWSHPDRQAIFVGGLIDKGSDPCGALVLAYRMIEAGNARMVIGNHELNWIHAAANAINDPDRFMRATASHYSRQSLVDSFADNPEGLIALFQWLRGQPVFIDEPDLRVVHACWDDSAITCLKERGINALDDNALTGYRTQYSEIYFALDLLIAGCEHTNRQSPDVSVFLTDRQRIRWWDPQSTRNNPIELQPQPGRHPGYRANAPPVFFGHYAMAETPRLQAHNQAGVDYSAAYGCELVAYRHKPGALLDESRFVRI